MTDGKKKTYWLAKLSAYCVLVVPVMFIAAFILSGLGVDKDSYAVIVIVIVIFGSFFLVSEFLSKHSADEV